MHVSIAQSTFWTAMPVFHKRTAPSILGLARHFVKRDMLACVLLLYCFPKITSSWAVHDMDSMCSYYSPRPHMSSLEALRAGISSNHNNRAGNPKLGATDTEESAKAL